MDNEIPVWKLIVTWLVRILTGALFIFSGFVKAIDPWGTYFKFEEYLSAIGFELWPSMLTVCVFALCAVEFVVGCFLLTGCYRKSCPIVAALIMAFMLPLTLWVMIENPVPDCGCFGDALVLSNPLTFIKNIVISAGIIWLIFYNTKALCLVSPYFQWLAVMASGLFIVIIELMGFFYQPLIDFRGYPVGSGLFSAEAQEDDGDYRFIYEKDGVEKEFGIDDELPDENDGWTFKGRKSDKKITYEENSVKGLHIFDIDTDEDVTSESAEDDASALVVMMPNVAKVSPATTWKLNSLYEWSKENDIRMIGIVSGNKEDIATWEDLSMNEYPIYMADDTSIKEVVRGNPGVVYLHDGKVVWKSTLSAIDVDDFLQPEVSDDPSSFGLDTRRILLDITFIYLIVMAFLVFISFTPRIARILTAGGLASKRGIRHH